MQRSAAAEALKVVLAASGNGGAPWGDGSEVGAGEVLERVVALLAEEAVAAADRAEMTPVALARWSQHEGFEPETRAAMACQALRLDRSDARVRFLAGSTLWLRPDAGDDEIDEGVALAARAAAELDGRPWDEEGADERQAAIVGRHRDGDVAGALGLLAGTP